MAGRVGTERSVNSKRALTGTGQQQHESSNRQDSMSGGMSEPHQNDSQSQL